MHRRGLGQSPGIPHHRADWPGVGRCQAVGGGAHDRLAPARGAREGAWRPALLPDHHRILTHAARQERRRERRNDGTGRCRARAKGAAPEFASHWLAPELPAFRAKHPQIELQILVGTRERDLTRGEAELSIQSPRPRQQGLVAVRIAHTTAALYASKALIGSGRFWVDSVEALRDFSLLIYTSPYQMLQQAKWFQTILSSATIGLETNSTHTLLAAARAGAGIAVLPRFIAREDDDLIAVSDNVADHDVWLITHPEFRRDPKVRATADFLKRIAAGPSGLC